MRRAQIQTYLAGVATVALVSSGGRMEVTKGGSSGDSDLHGRGVRPGALAGSEHSAARAAANGRVERQRVGVGEEGVAGWE